MKISKMTDEWLLRHRASVMYIADFFDTFFYKDVRNILEHAISRIREKQS